MTSKVSLATDRAISKAFAGSALGEAVLWEVLPVRDGESMRLTFEHADANGRHGVWLACDGELTINGLRAASVDLWSDTSPSCVEIHIQTPSGRLHLYNIWDKGKGRQSQSWSSGMLVDDINAGKRFRCNDIGLHGSFEDLIFRIERV